MYCAVNICCHRNSSSVVGKHRERLRSFHVHLLLFFAPLTPDLRDIMSDGPALLNIVATSRQRWRQWLSWCSVLTLVPRLSTFKLFAKWSSEWPRLIDRYDARRYASKESDMACLITREASEVAWVKPESSQSPHTSAKAMLFARRQHHLRFCSGFPYAPLKAMVTKKFKVIHNLGFLPDHPQNWITGRLCHSWHTLKISERFVHNFLSYLAQTDRQTDKQSPAKTLPPWRR